MMWLTSRWVIPIIIGLVLVLVVYSFTLQTINQPFYTYKKYCGSCHFLPDPKDLPKQIWIKDVLPDMAARLGLRINNYDPYQKIRSMEEHFYLESAGVYPQKPLISQKEWDELYQYIVSQSPDYLKVTNYGGRSKPLTQFDAQTIDMDKRKGALITYLDFNRKENSLYAGDALGKLYQWQQTSNEFKLIDFANTPIIGYTKIKETQYLTEIGIMTPSEVPMGKIYYRDSGGRKVLYDKLHRPVFSNFVDLNKDGEAEILVGEFGNNLGELSMLRKNQAGKYEKTTLLGLPGVVRVIPTDINKDGNLDLVILATQAREGVYVLYNDGNLKFTLKNLIQIKPNYGLSWFELFDYEGDGDLDIVMVNGDNADYSPILKPYHGLRIYLNDGKNQFEESFFYPIHGATRLIAKDFDKDNDIDFAVTSFFPDFKNNIQESFVYLENKNAKKFQFEPYTFPQAEKGRWMVIESGDFDQDGDEDIMLGSFDKVSGAGKMNETWENDNIDLIWLENKLIKKKNL